MKLLLAVLLFSGISLCGQQIGIPAGSGYVAGQCWQVDSAGQGSWGQCSATTVNQTQTLYDVSTFSGADMGAKIATCFATYLACDARSITGAQSASATLTLPNNALLLVGNATLAFASSAQVIYGQNSTIRGIGELGTRITGNVSGSFVIPGTNKGYPVLDSLSIENTAAYSSTTYVVEFNGVSDFYMNRVKIIPNQGNGVYIHTGSYYGYLANCWIAMPSGGAGTGIVVTQNQTSLMGTKITGGTNGLQVAGGVAVEFVSGDIEGTSNDAVISGNLSSVYLRGGYIQASSGYALNANAGGTIYMSGTAIILSGTFAYVDPAGSGKIISPDSYVDGISGIKFDTTGATTSRYNRYTLESNGTVGLLLNNSSFSPSNSIWDLNFGLGGSNSLQFLPETDGFAAGSSPLTLNRDGSAKIGGVTIRSASGAPTGSCTGPAVYFDSSTGKQYNCESGSWVEK